MKALPEYLLVLLSLGVGPLVLLGHHLPLPVPDLPEGLRGDAIPLAAQILSISDTFDAMTTDRPYQKAMEPNYVVGKIKGWKGIRFRESVVEGFVRAFEEGAIQVEEKENPGEDQEKEE